MHDEKNMGKIPKVHLSSDNGIQECYMLVYKALSATVVVLLDGKSIILLTILITKPYTKYLQNKSELLCTHRCISAHI